MIENIPQQYRTDEALKEYFEFLFPGGAVDSAVIARDPLKLPELLKKRNKVAESLEAAYVSLHLKSARPKHRVLVDHDSNDDSDSDIDEDEGIVELDMTVKNTKDETRVFGTARVRLPLD